VLLPDVNVLVYAHREDAPRHAEFKAWLARTLAGPTPCAVSDLVLSGFLRVVTHPAVFRPPSPLAAALAFAEEVRTAPAAVTVAPGDRHWEIFVRLCRQAGARANLIPDAFLAALAIETGSDLVTTDRDFTRFPGLRMRHPLDEPAP